MKARVEERLQQHYDELIAANPNPDVCPLCGGLGYVGIEAHYTHPLFGKAFHCPCGMVRQALRQRFADLYAEICKTPGVPESHQGYTLASFVDYCATLGEDSMKHKKNAYDAARRLVRFGVIAAGSVEKYWIVLSGETGMGKSGVAAGIALAFIEKGLPVLWRNCNDLIDMVQATYSRGKNDKGPSKEDIIYLLQNVPILVIDDMGDPDSYEEASGDARKIMFSVLHHRHEKKLITIITTNLGKPDPQKTDRNDFKKMWGKRIFRRVDERAVWIPMAGPDLSTY